MELRQSGALGSVKTRFVFGGETLEFAEEIGSTQRTFAIPYEQIPVDYTTVTTISRHFARLYAVSILLATAVVFAAFISGAAPAQQGAAAGRAVLTCVLLLVAGRFFARPFGRITVTVFKTPLGSIEVLGGEHRDEILKTIADRRRTVVRAKFCQINPANHPQNEIQRFRLLKEKGFIDEAELAEALRELSSRLAPQNLRPDSQSDPDSKRPLS